jgi:hypothetical protein
MSIYAKDKAYAAWWKTVKREKGYMYGVDKTGNIWAIPMKHNPSGRRHIVGEKGTPALLEIHREKRGIN